MNWSVAFVSVQCGPLQTAFIGLIGPFRAVRSTTTQPLRAASGRPWSACVFSLVVSAPAASAVSAATAAMMIFAFMSPIIP